jgi:hypothetical protein
MRQPEIIAKVHTPEVAKKRGLKRSLWLHSGHPKAIAELARVAALNSMEDPQSRLKLSHTLKQKRYKPSARGGNGTGLTVPQKKLLAVLSGDWMAELPISLIRHGPGFPSHYKVDIGSRTLKIGIELDGHTHRSRTSKDQKKDAKLATLGWTVLRFWNWDILTWINGGMPPDSSISTTLKQNGIHLSPSTDS